MGSIDFFAVARSVLLVGRVEGEENIRAVVQIKNNLAAFGHPKAFTLSENGFEWLGDYEIMADEVLGGIAPRSQSNKFDSRGSRQMDMQAYPLGSLLAEIKWNRRSVCFGNWQKQIMLCRAMRFSI